MRRIRAAQLNKPVNPGYREDPVADVISHCKSAASPVLEYIG